MASNLIEIKDLRKSFRVGDTDVPVLKGINIKITSGEFVIIFGPSGCGKSTLLHSILGLEKPTSGEVLIEGKNYYDMTEDQRAIYRRHKVGMIYQQPLWIGPFSVVENVCFPLYLLDKDQAVIEPKAMQLLTKVGMDKWAKYSPTELSSGQQQKISLVRSLMTDPLWIVADEPTGNLDTVSGQELLQTFISLVAEGKTIIMVTHDLEYLKFATKIYHMIDGEVVEEYSPQKNGSEQWRAAGKKEINGNLMDSNVRDRDFLKKLKI